MSILTQRPPESAYILGVETPARTDFRTGIKFELLALAGGGVGELTRLWFPDWRGDPAAALEAALWLYRCGRTDSPGQDGWGEPVYDFEQDADALLASFASAYGIDLSTREMHWWVFRRLMLGLPEDCAFMRILRLRTADVSGMDGESRAKFERARRIYALRPRGGSGTLAERDARWRAGVERSFARAARAERGGGESWHTTEA